MLITKALNKLWSIITIIAILLIGFFATCSLVRDYNIQSTIFGNPANEVTSYKIDDFTFQVNSLIFSESGEDNKLISNSTTLPVINYNNSKKYTLKVNDNICNYIEVDNYICAEFNKKFYGIENQLLLESTMKISIHFYKDYTRIIFLIEGENADNYWSKYIVNNGLKIEIVEQKYFSNIDADNLPNYNLNLYYDNELYQTISFNTFKDFELPQIIDNKKVNSWVDINNVTYTKDTIPFENINLYAVVEIDNFSLSCNNDNILTIKNDAYGAFRYNSKEMNIIKTQDIDFFNRLYLEETDFDCSIKITDFYGYDFTIGKEYMTYKGGDILPDSDNYDKQIIFETHPLEQVWFCFILYYDSVNNIAEFEFVISFDNDQLYPELFPAFNEDSLNNEMNFIVTLDLSII